MSSHQDLYDDAMVEYSMGQYDAALAKFLAILSAEPAHFEAQMALAMSHYRKGEFTRAIEEGHKAERLKPDEQLVHTNLSLFYQKIGDKKTAEHHGLQARIASWRGNMTAPTPSASQTADPDLEMAKPKPAPVAPPAKFPDMPWKNKPKLTASHPDPGPSAQTAAPGPDDSDAPMDPSTTSHSP